MHHSDLSRDVHHGNYSDKRISWSAIVIGALIALGLSFLLNLFSMAIGLSAYSADGPGNDSGEAIALGGLIGLLIGTIASMLAAGYAAGYLGRLFCPRRNLGILYGFSTWTLSLVLAAVIAVPLANMVKNTTHGSAPAASVQPTKSTSADDVSVQTKSSGAGDTQAANVKAPAKTMAWGLFSMFTLFFLGAVACCLGAHWGMSCKREDD
ncbi:MAG: hypothetical protein H0U57_12855 [Tatlockia sp.]|nr:hypothetical protein [Tatlockia sp.]